MGGGADQWADGPTERRADGEGHHLDAGEEAVAGGDHVIREQRGLKEAELVAQAASIEPSHARTTDAELDPTCDAPAIPHVGACGRARAGVTAAP